MVKLYFLCDKLECQVLLDQQAVNCEDFGIAVSPLRVLNLPILTNIEERDGQFEVALQ